MKFEDIKEKYASGKITKHEYIEQMHSQHLSLFEYADLIQDCDIKSIEIRSDDIIMTSKKKGIRLYASKDDMRIASMEMLNFGSYDEAELNMIDQLVQEDVVFFDVGANAGWYSLSIAKMKSRARIYAFEPIPKTVGILHRNLELNKQPKNIKVYPHGFSDKAEELTFYYYPEGSGNASLENLSDRPDVEQIKCMVIRMDEFTDNSSGRVDLIKCDVEGAELFVFKGGIETIKTYKPVIFTEMLRKWAAAHKYHPNDIIDLLSAIGYGCFVLNGDRLSAFSKVDEKTVETNYFFLHKEKHAREINRLVC